MATKRSTVAPITVYTNGNKYDSKRFVFNPKYVRTFDAFLDQITTETNATCAVRKIYTPHGSRQVGKLSSIEPGGRYVAVSRGHFKKISYGKTIDPGLSSAGTTTTKTTRKSKISGRLQRSYEDQLKTQKTIYVQRNGFNEPATQIFFNKRLLRSLSQVLDFVQEKITCERAIVSLHKLNGVTIDDVSKLQPEGRYVAVEQGQRFRHCSYDQIDTGATSPRRIKLPVIKPQRVNPTGQKPHQRHPSDDSSQQQTSRSKPKIKLPLIKHNLQDFHIVYGYPDKYKNELQNTSHARENTRGPHEGGSTHRSTNLGIFHARGPQHDVQNTQGENTHRSTQKSTKTGPFYASGAQQEIAIAIRDDKRVRVEKPLDMMPAEQIEEQLDGVDYHGNAKRSQSERRVKPIATERRSKEIPQPIKAEKASKENVTLPHINNKVPKPPAKNTSFPTKPSIAHPRKHAQSKHWQQNSNEVVIPKSTVNDQRLVSQDNNMATTKKYIVTREQRLLDMHGRDGRKHAKGVVHVYESDMRIKGLERENQELQKKKRIEEWVGYTVEVKQKEDEISSVAKQLVTTALANAAMSFDMEEPNNGNRSVSNNKQNNNNSGFYKGTKNEVKYHRVFGQ